MGHFVKVLIPLKFREELTYLLPEGMTVSKGDWVKVPVGRGESVGIVIGTIEGNPGIDPLKMREITEKISLSPVTEKQFEFWNNLASYYMCSLGDVLKAACPEYLQKQAEVKRPKLQKCRTVKSGPLPELSKAQKVAFDEVISAFAGGKTALLHGVTGSGKTEIYMHAAREMLDKGMSVLFLVPEIAISKQLQSRLESVFGEQLMVFHSGQTAVQRKRVHDKLTSTSEPCLVMGTRSAVFLPMKNIGLVIVDEEHDASYKQDEPAPRYNGRDAAMLLAAMNGAEVLLGSATPSLESLFNVSCGKYRKINLTEKYYNGACEPDIVILDTIRARRNKDMQGAFSKHLLREIEKTVERGEQALIFRSRRAYSSMVQCSACGDVPTCPKCGVPLTYHKFNGTLECHYCGYHRKFNSTCGKCGTGEAVLPLGAGTERLEEELTEHFPTYRIARFDSDTAQSKIQSEKILGEFARGDTDILVGTQMITKGFDFDKLTLVAVIAADSLLALQDFRADERALQMLRQFRGRAGRRERKGMMFIQTSQPNHPVFKRLLGGQTDSDKDTGDILAERKGFNFPPFVRLVTLTVQDRNEGELWHVSREIVEILGKCKVPDFSGPITPAVNKVGGWFINQFWIKLPRTASSAKIKRELFIRLDALTLRFKRKPQITIDVDPL